MTPLCSAVQARHAKLCRLLLTHAADPNVCDDKGVAPLHLAAFAGNGPFIKLLLDARADANIADRHGQTALFFAPTKRVCDILLKGGADATITNNKQQSALHIAAHAGLADIITSISGATDGCMLNVKDSHGYTAHHYAGNPAGSPKGFKSVATSLSAMKQCTSAILDARLSPKFRKADAPAVADAVDHAEEEAAAAAKKAEEDAAAAKSAEEMAVALMAPEEAAAARRKAEEEAAASNVVEEEAVVPYEAFSEEVLQEEMDGCLRWRVVLEKDASSDKFGFVRMNGKAEFEHYGIPDPRGGSVAAPNVLIVRKVSRHGLLMAWNSRHPEAAVFAQDRIACINGETSIEGMDYEVMSRRIVMEMVRYPDAFTVTMNKADRKLGFKITAELGVAQTLRITRVLADGALPDYNAYQISMGRWHYVVHQHMIIEAVNGVEGNAQRMAQILQEEDQVSIDILRAETTLRVAASPVSPSSSSRYSPSEKGERPRSAERVMTRTY